MTRAILVLCLLTACTESTELLDQRRDAHPAGPDGLEVSGEVSRNDGSVNPDSDMGHADTSSGDAVEAPRRNYCPTRIDVYGGINMQLAGCGGDRPTSASLADGYFAPGTPGYDSTVAGRLLVRLTDDPDLVPRFGSTWTVRSCAGPGATLAQMVPPLSDDDCGSESPDTAASWREGCMNDPAPVLLLAAGMLDDGCHGGRPDSSHPDDPATYSLHYGRRLDAFLASRDARLALVGPATEWTLAPPLANDGSWTCDWQRPQWDEMGLQGWAASSTDAPNTVMVPDLHTEFFDHSRCCQGQDSSCSTNWFGHSTPEIANCDGAQAIVDFWYTQLKTALLARDFQCP